MSHMLQSNTATPIERLAEKVTLDEIDLPSSTQRDTNDFMLSSILDHNGVIASFPWGYFQ